MSETFKEKNNFNFLLVALIAMALAAPLGSVMAEEDPPPAPIEEAADLAALGQRAAANGMVIMLLVSQDHCPYCVLIKEEIVRPMIRGGDFPGQLLIRELFIDLDRRVIGFDGEDWDAGTLAAHYEATLTPTLLFLGPRGEELSDRLVGINTPEMYFYYVDEAIRKALQVIEVRREL